MNENAAAPVGSRCLRGRRLHAATSGTEIDRKCSERSKYKARLGLLDDLDDAHDRYPLD